MILGFLVFVLLSASAVVASVAVGVRAKWEDRAELSVGTFILAHSLITFPTLALGWINHLSRPILGLTVFAASAATFLATCHGVGITHQVRETQRALAGLARLPVDAFLLAARRRHFAALALALTVATTLYTMWLSYMAPPIGWDGLWYHDTIVGYAIQNRGFKFLELPASLDYVNSFPRVCEMMNLWFVIFTDRRFLEMVTETLSPALVASFYVLARRFDSSRLGALTWALVLFWLPGALLQFNSTYIDTHIVTIHIATIAFALRPKFRLRDALVACLGFGLLSGTKGHALTWIPFSGAVAFGRLFWQNFSKQKGATLAVAAAGIASIGFVAAPTYVRNWLRYKNPVYPIDVASETFKLHFPGHQRLSDIARPFWRVISDLYVFHTPGGDHFDIGGHGYGDGIPWVVLPLAAVGFLAAAWTSITARVFRRDSSRTDNLLLSTIPLLVTAPLSPALWSARYNLHVVAAVMLLAVWATSSRGLRLFGDVPASACLVLSFIFIYFAEPAWAIKFDEAKRMAREDTLGRATFEWPGYWGLHEFALRRETELKPHDVVAYTEANMFPSMLWNDRYENEVVFVHYTGQFLADLDAIHAKWATVFAGRSGYAELTGSPAWEEVGPVSRNTERWMYFRRR